MGRQNDVIAAVVTLLKAIPGVHGVDDRPGGEASWVKSAKPKRSYFWVDINKKEEEEYTLGPLNHLDYNVTIEGWMPLDYKSNTAATWRDLLDAIDDLLREKWTLEGAVAEVGPPQMPVSNYELFSGASGFEATCHHCRIEMRVGVDLTYDRT